MRLCVCLRVCLCVSLCVSRVQRCTRPAAKQCVCINSLCIALKTGELQHVEALPVLGQKVDGLHSQQHAHGIGVVPFNGVVERGIAVLVLVGMHTVIMSKCQK